MDAARSNGLETGWNREANKQEINNIKYKNTNYITLILACFTEKLNISRRNIRIISTLFVGPLGRAWPEEAPAVHPLTGNVLRKFCAAVLILHVCTEN